MFFNEELENLNKFSIIFKKKKFNFFFIYKIIYAKLLFIENYLKQFFFNLIKLKKNCFKYKYFFFNLIKYLVILKKKYLYLTTFNLFSKILTNKIFLSEKFNNKLMTLCTLKKKYIFKLKKKINKKKKYFLLKTKTKKYLRYVLWNLKKLKKLKKSY
jgi:hypothetical protein